MTGIVVAVPRLHHGLGNRIRVLMSAWDLADAEGREFRYVWPTGRPFGARLDDLWHVEAAEMSPFRSRMLALRHPYRDAAADWRAGAVDDRIWQIRTSQPIELNGRIDGWHERFRRLRPVASIERRVHARFDAGLRGRPYVGVMVRSHAVSHQKTLEASPLGWYLERMTDLRRQNPDIPFYVSADTVEAWDAVEERFPGIGGAREKGPYNSREAVEGAVVDLYLLASSSHILGPHYSSFPEMAQFLAGPAVELETSQTGTEGVAVMSRVGLVSDPTTPGRRSFAD